MKKFYFFIVLLLVISLKTAAQSAKEEIDIAAKEIELSKTGNYKDILAGFFQLAFKVSEQEKAIEFNTTLFAALKNYNPDALQTMDRPTLYFLRNMQVNLKADLDSNYKLKGYTGGATYAIVNLRDKEFTIYTGHIADAYTTFLKIGAKATAKAITQAVLKAIADNEPLSAYDTKKLSKSYQDATRELLLDPATKNPIALTIETFLDTEINNTSFLDKDGNAITSTKQFIAYLQQLRTDYLKDMETKPLWTVSAQGSSKDNGKLRKGVLETIYLKGTTWNELDVRAKFSYADTTAISLPRTALNAKGGWNFKILKGKDQKSFFEIKAYGEYNKVLRNVLPDEKKQTFMLDADFRLRLTDDLWLPLTIKYDTANANLLGFLNVTYNFGG